MSGCPAQIRPKDACKVLRAARPAPIPESKAPRRRWAKVNLALGPRYPCGHPRTVANSYMAGDFSVCATCAVAAAHSRRLEARV